MRLLLDTHIALWFAIEPGRLTDAENHLLTAENEIAVSAVSLWELRLKWDAFYRSGERKGPADPRTVLAALTRLDLRLIDLDPAQAATSLVHSLPHKDPFDELLVVQAQELDMMLLTRDARLIGHPLALPSIA